MVAVRAMLARATRLEQSRVSPWLKVIGSIEQFKADVQAGIDEGIYDPRDMPSVVASIERWTREGMW